MAAIHTGPNIASLKLLVVDDHMSFRGILLRMLKDFGFANIDQAANFTDADEILKRRNTKGGSFYDIAFFDLHMPGGSGWDLLKKCREDRAFDNMCILIVSADGSRASLTKALQQGAMDFVVKPFKDIALKAHLNKSLIWLERNAAMAAPARLLYFIDPEDYTELRHLCADCAELFPESYDGWYEEHMRTMRHAEENGETAFEIVAFPAEFKAWCSAASRQPAYGALQDFIRFKHKLVR